MRNIARPEVLELCHATEYAKEISTLAAAEQYHLDPAEIVDLSLNTNFLGPSPRVAEAVRTATARLYEYPDVALRSLKTQIGRSHGLPPDHVLLGDGLDEVLKLIAQAFVEPEDEAVIPVPTFPRYELEVRIMGGCPRLIRLTDDFEVAVEKVLDCVSERTKLIFLCSPNNPAGVPVGRDAILRLLEFGDHGPLVVVDEAMIFPCDRGVVDLLPEHRNLMVLRTFSKYFGLAGARVGYALSHPEILAYMDVVRPPFNVNLLGEAAVLAALDDAEHLHAAQAQIAAEREALGEALNRLPGILVHPSQATTILVDVKGTGLTSTQVTHALAARGVLVVDCRSYPGLEDKDYLRISVGLPDCNRRLVAALTSALESHKLLSSLH